jgi:hypothetical protein
MSTQAVLIICNQGQARQRGLSQWHRQAIEQRNLLAKFATFARLPKCYICHTEACQFEVHHLCLEARPVVPACAGMLVAAAAAAAMPSRRSRTTWLLDVVTHHHELLLLACGAASSFPHSPGHHCGRCGSTCCTAPPSSCTCSCAPRPAAAAASAGVSLM